MENFGNRKVTTIQSELPDANYELGQGFAFAINDMVVQSGITNPKASPLDIVPPSWKKLANTDPMTTDIIKKLDEVLFGEINLLAQSYLLFIARETKNTTGQITLEQYEEFLFKYRFGHYSVMNRANYTDEVKAKIKIAFGKIVSHGTQEKDHDVITKEDMAYFIYALMTNSRRNEKDEFIGFSINGTIKPEDYALNEHFLFEDRDNLFSGKLRIAYKAMNGII